jgi:hypothetical protein
VGSAAGKLTTILGCRFRGRARRLSGPRQAARLQPSFHPDEINPRLRPAHRLNDLVEAEKRRQFGVTCEHFCEPLLDIAERMRQAAPRGEPGGWADGPWVGLEIPGLQHDLSSEIEKPQGGSFAGSWGNIATTATGAFCAIHSKARTRAAGAWSGSAGSKIKTSPTRLSARVSCASSTAGATPVTRGLRPLSATATAASTQGGESPSTVLAACVPDPRNVPDPQRALTRVPRDATAIVLIFFSPER